MDLYHSFIVTQSLSDDAINVFKWSQVSQHLWLISSCHLFYTSHLLPSLDILSIAYPIISKSAELTSLVYRIGNPFKSKTLIFNQNPRKVT